MWSWRAYWATVSFPVLSRLRGDLQLQVAVTETASGCGAGRDGVARGGHAAQDSAAEQVTDEIV